MISLDEVCKIAVESLAKKNTLGQSLRLQISEIGGFFPENYLKEMLRNMAIALAQ